MKRLIVLCVAAVIAGGVLYAEPRSETTFEGEVLSSRTIKKMEKTGEHRYYNQFITHNAKALKHEIDLLNMLNSLYLNNVQMNSLILVSTKLERARRLHEKEVAKLNKELEKGYAALRKRALAGETVDACALPESCQKARKRLGEISGELRREAVKRQEQAKAILTENQIEKVYNYQHCLIPVKDLKDPTRIGQADAASKNEKMLKRVRGMTDEQFEDQVPRIIDKHIKGIEYYCGEMSPEQKKEEGERYKVVLAKARKMTGLDFEFNRDKIAAELNDNYHDIKDRMKHVGNRLAKVRHDQGCGSIDVVGSMFLSPNMLHILAKRVNINKGFKGTQAVDLDTIEDAATKAGGCAID